MSRDTYLYDVPDTCMNFRELNEEDGVDAWFDYKAGLLNTPLSDVPMAAAAADVFPKAASSRANLPRAIVSPMIKCDEAPNENHAPEGAYRVPPNLVVSMGEWHSKTNEAAAPKKAPGRVARRLSAQRKNAPHRLATKNRAERCTSALANKEDAPPPKKLKMSDSREQLREIAPNRSVSPSRAKAKRTGPSLPTTPERNPLAKLKSTEELELERMQKLQQEVVEMRRKNEESLKVAVAGPGQPVKKTVIQLTKPVDFHFSTDDRIKQHGESQTGTDYKEVDFAALLRKHPPSPARVAKGSTVPKPFNLSQGNKRKHEATVPEFVSLAQQIEKFQRSTPSRYHLRSRKEEEAPRRPLKAVLTNPKTPCLETKNRSRGVTCKSSAQLEEEELAALQQYKFKAQELNPRILEAGPILPKKPPVKEPTKPIGFDLEIEKRIQERESRKPQTEEHFEFHSKPCPTRILEEVVGVPEKKPLPITIPKSPAFALRNKVGTLAREEEKEKEEEVVPVIKAKPMPHFGVPFKPKAVEPRQVEVCPFSFDSRDREKLLQKEKKIEELQKGEVPKFKAHPIPQFDRVSLPEKKVKSATKPEPFQLHIDQRGAVKQELWQQQIKVELKQQKEAASFKAHPSTVVHQEPFVPRKECKPLAVPEGFELATERRARERQEFEKRLANVEAEKARAQEEAKRLEEEQERERLARLREELVHKANPIRRYQNVEVKPSDQPLTVPKSPDFSDRFQC